MRVLELIDVHKQYGDKTAVNGIRFEVGQGEIYGLLGANGAGKTTTMRMVLGLIYPDQGQIRYKGKALGQDVARRIGYLPEERGLYPKVRVSDQLIYLARLKGTPRKQAEQSLRLWLERFAIPDYYNKRVEELSKGNQQKIQFIAAVIHDPELMILDEAFSGLDPVNVELLKDTVKQLRDQGKTILFSTHRMEHVEELCRSITILHRSNTVLQGSLKKIKQSYPKERVLLGTSAEVHGLEKLACVRSINRRDYGYELYIDDARPEAARSILELALAQTDVNRFEIMEPTLNEIFIRSVGERHE